jgi:hypothetical protein
MAARVLPAEQAAALGVGGAALSAWLELPAGTAAEERIAVHANGYPARIHESLAATFPAVAHVVGTGAFEALAHRYLARVALSSYNLNDAGAELPRLLQDDELSAALPFLPDLAVLECKVAAAFHARERRPLEPASLAGLAMEDWERARLAFQPSVGLVVSAWPILDVWNHRETPIEEIDIDLNGRPQSVLVSRAGFEVRCQELARSEAEILAALLDGRSLGEVATLPAAADESTDVSTLFAAWMLAGLVTDVG